MRRRFLRHGLVASALLIAFGASAQNAPAPSQSVPAKAPAMTPALPTLAPGPAMPAATQPGTAAQPSQTTPATPPGYGGGGGGGYGGSSYGQAPGAGQSVPDARMLSRSDGASTAFRALDPMNRGYVTRADTDQISGFTGFDNADTDRDGRLTPEEFQNAWKFFAQ
jgi:hypothetical protein